MEWNGKYGTIERYDREHGVGPVFVLYSIHGLLIIVAVC